MKSNQMLRRVRWWRIWAGRLMLAGLVCLEVWVVGRCVGGWCGLGSGTGAQAYAVDVAMVFAGR